MNIYECPSVPSTVLGIIPSVFSGLGSLFRLTVVLDFVCSFVYFECSFLSGFDFSLRFLSQPGLKSSFRVFLFGNHQCRRQLIGKFLEIFLCLCLNVYIGV